MQFLRRLLPFVLTLVLVTFSFAERLPVSAASVVTLPTGFVDEAVYTGLLVPRAFTFTPDGRVLVTERGSESSNDSNLASIRVYKNGALLPTRAYTIKTCGDSERGLLGIALDPQFANNGYIYIYYTRQATSGAVCGYNTFTQGSKSGPRNRISRLTMSGDTVVPGSERVLIDSIVTDVGYHNGGDLRFGLDGYLYATTGEAGVSWTSPDTGTLNGKVLRILPTAGAAGGYTTAGNPYNTAVGARNCSAPASIGLQGTSTGPCKEIFAKGFRNPFRFTIQPIMTGIPGSGSPFVADVGAGAWEEVDQAHAGGDYGWPIREGYCSNGVLCSPPYQTAGYDSPIYAYPHNSVNGDTGAAIIGGDFYVGGAGYPAQYINNYFFTDNLRGFIARLVYNASNGQWTRPSPDFATGGNALIGLKRGPDGNLYYLNALSETNRVSAIHRIRYEGAGNLAPSAQASVNPQAGPLSTVYTFSAAGSVDPEGNVPLSYNWDFGDGTKITTQNVTVTHVYSRATNIVAKLTVTDSGQPPATSAPTSVNVYPGNTPPTGTIVLTNQTDGTRTKYYAGDTWAYSAANVTDDEPLPANAISWEVAFHHREHTHPFVPLVQAKSGQFTIPNAGELDPVVWYRVHLYITDVRGQRTEVTKDVYPVTKVLTFNTYLPGGQVTVDGGIFPTPFTITRVVGMHFLVDVPSPQTILMGSYTFKSWSQGGSKQQTIIVPPTDTTYSIAFNAPPNAAPLRNFFTTRTPTLTWNRVTGALRYDVQIATNPTFTGATIYPVSNQLSFTTPVLSDGFYYWHVRACSTALICGTWSPADTFAIDGP